MPQVPYQPFSTEQPQSGGERVSVSTPPAAFGVNVAQAVEGLGGQLEKSGDELFTRAMALQDLRNETDAREAQTQYAEKASELHAQYGALEGKAAADGLQGYIKAQADLRTQFRDGLKTQFAQRYYDRDTLPFMQRNIFSAAGHAADQNKASVIGTAQAQKDITARTFVDPKSDGEFQHKLETTNSADETIAAARGMTPEQLTDLKMHSASGLWLGRIGQTAHDDPQAALKMLDENKGSMTQDDYGKALQVTRAQNRAIGGANLVNDVYSPDKTAAQMEAEIKDRSADLAHGDPLFEKDALTGLRGKITTDRYVKNQDDNTAIQSIQKQIGDGVTDIRDLRLRPGMAQAIDSLPDSKKNEIPGMITRFNASRDKAGHEQNYTQLTGMYYNDREQFLDTDFTKYDLSQPQIRDLMAKRAQAVAKPTDDPMLNRAMGWLRQGRAAELRALGIYFRPTQGADATDYDHYTGALQAGIDAWRQEHGKPPGYKDIVDTIGPSVIHQRTEPGTFGMLFGGKQRPAFDQDMSVVKDWAEKKGLVDEIKSRGGADPTDEELYRAFLRSQFIDLYSKPTGGDSGRPTVPQSK
jgi:hypothetical protein